MTHVGPSWTQNPITLADANDASAYTAAIGSYAKAGDPGDKLVISKGTDAPAWISVAADGSITGNPTPGSAGNYTFTAIVTDQTGASASATVQLAVDHVPPKWIVNPIAFTTAEDQTFSASIIADAQAAVSTETLTFSLVSGPNWLTVAANGTISGTPVLANEGVNTFVVRVTDNYSAVATPDATLTITVTHTAPSWTQNPIVLPDANDAATYTATMGSYAKGGDPGDTLTITVGTDAPKWLTMAATGTITANPTPGNAGAYSFTAIATDQAGVTASATVQLTVDHVPPKWVVNPITFTAPEDQAFTASIAKDAVAAVSTETLTFSLVSGPNWLKVGTDGTISGTPVLANEGVNTFVVHVADNFKGAATPDATLTITVPHTAPSWTQNPIVLPDANDASTYTANIGTYVKAGDPGDTLTITVGTDAPKWLSISATGSITANPAPANIGSYSFTAIVTDQTGATASTTIQLKVDHVPPTWSANPIVLPQWDNRCCLFAKPHELCCRSACERCAYLLDDRTCLGKARCNKCDAKWYSCKF